jgi:F-type H+-transporting ATPase subunit b
MSTPRISRQGWLAIASLAALVVISRFVGESWKPAFAKAFNFIALVGLLVYFLRGTVATYLAGRRETIRKDLVEAAALRATAEQQLTAVQAHLRGLPAEIETLRRQGQEELADEQARMKDATARARAMLLDRARRDVDLRLRVARRALFEHTADLAVRLARTRVQHAMTADDQTRLIERYAREVRP